MYLLQLHAGLKDTIKNLHKCRSLRALSVSSRRGMTFKGWVSSNLRNTYGSNKFHEGFFFAPYHTSTHAFDYSELI